MLHDAGWTSLVPTYRNDEDVPAGPDGRYNLGLSEWRDLEAAVDHAVRSGAQEVLLVGWSMGGAIVLQFLDRSPLADVVSRGRTAVLVGGSGLYVRAALDELAFPETDPAVRARLEAELAEAGTAGEALLRS